MAFLDKFGFFIEIMLMNRKVLLGESRISVLEVFYRCFQNSNNFPLTLRSHRQIFQWFDVGVASCCCQCFQLIINFPSLIFNDATYFLAGVYVLCVLPEQELISLAYDLPQIKNLAFQLFALMNDQSHLDFFIQCYSFRNITTQDIRSKFLILQRYRHVIFP